MLILMNFNQTPGIHNQKTHNNIGKTPISLDTKLQQTVLLFALKRKQAIAFKLHPAHTWVNHPIC